MYTAALWCRGVLAVNDVGWDDMILFVGLQHCNNPTLLPNQTMSMLLSETSFY
jgi:hypothetical protein